MRWVRWGAEPMGWRRMVTVGELGEERWWCEGMHGWGKFILSGKGKCGMMNVKQRKGKDKNNDMPFCTTRSPAFSSALLASRGKCVSTTDAAMVRGASCVSSSSDGMRSFGEFVSDILILFFRRLLSKSVISRLFGFWEFRIVTGWFGLVTVGQASSTRVLWRSVGGSGVVC